jgi:hypothetical protein
LQPAPAVLLEEVQEDRITKETMTRKRNADFFICEYVLTKIKLIFGTFIMHQLLFLMEITNLTF